MFNNLDDPKTQLLMMMGLGLLGGAPGKNKNFGADLAHGGLLGLQGYSQAKQGQERAKQRSLQEEMQRMQLEQMRRQQENEGKMWQAFQSAFGPNPNAMNFQGQPMGDDMGNPMPQAPGGGGMPEFIKNVGGFDPRMALSMMPKPQGPVKMGRDDRLVDPTTRQELISASPAAQWRVLGRDEKTGQTIQENTVTGERKAVGSMPTQVNVSTNMPPLERQEQKDKGGLNVKNYGDMQAAANAARKEIALFTGLEKLDLDTNALTPANATVSAYVAALGGGERFKNVASQGQGFTAFTKDLVLQRQLAQKGPQTESDARRLEDTSAKLGNTKEANKLIINFGLAQNQRIVDQERFYADWWKKNKTYEGADDAWFAGKGGTSIWDDPRLKKFQDQGGSVTMRFDSQGNQR